MKKEKLELIGKGNSKANKRRGKSPGRNEYLESRECKENSSLKERVVIKDDGRYLIYYDF